MRKYVEPIIMLIFSLTIFSLLLIITALIQYEPEPETIVETKVVTVPRVIVRIVVETAEAETVITDEDTWTITAYCSCKTCCGKWYTDGPTIGSGGVELVEGVHCASPLPNGTQVIIEGVGLREVQDTPASWIDKKYNGKIIDLYFEDHEAALKFGKKKANVKVIS